MKVTLHLLLNPSTGEILTRTWNPITPGNPFLYGYTLEERILLVPHTRDISKILPYPSSKYLIQFKSVQTLMSPGEVTIWAHKIGIFDSQTGQGIAGISDTVSEDLINNRWQSANPEVLSLKPVFFKRLLEQHAEA